MMSTKKLMKKSPRRESRRSTGIFQNIFQQSIMNSLAADDLENPPNPSKDLAKSPAPGSYPARNIPKIDTTKDVTLGTENNFNEFVLCHGMVFKWLDNLNTYINIV